MFVHFCLALLAFASLTAASDPECEELAQPLKDHSKIFGKWIFHVGTSNNEEFLAQLKTVNSSWIGLTPYPTEETYNLRWGDNFNGTCMYGNLNSTLVQDSTKVTFSFNFSIPVGKWKRAQHVGEHLKTCPDCILWRDDAVMTSITGETQKGSFLYLFTKSRDLHASQMETFKKQAACLNFPSDHVVIGNTELCPEEHDAAVLSQNEA